MRQIRAFTTSAIVDRYAVSPDHADGGTSVRRHGRPGECARVAAVRQPGRPRCSSIELRRSGQYVAVTASSEPSPRYPWTRLAGRNDLAREVVTGVLRKRRSSNHEGEEFAAGAKGAPGLDRCAASRPDVRGEQEGSAPEGAAGLTRPRCARGFWPASAGGQSAPEVCPARIDPGSGAGHGLA
jgi:hypothetical protein